MPFAKRKVNPLALAAVGMLALLVVAAGLISSPARSAEPRSPRLERLNERLDSARARVEAIQERADTVTQQVESLDAQLASVRRALTSAANLASRTQQQLGIARRRVADEEERLARLLSQTEEIAVEMYKSGPTSELDVVLSAGNMSDLLSTIQYVDAASLNRRKVAAATAQARAKLHNSEMRLEERVTAAIKAREARAVEAQHLAELRAARSVTLARLRARIVAQRREAAHLAAASERIADRLLAASTSQYHGPSSAAGFSWPVAGSITSGFGQRWGRLHAGLDIDCETGDPIRAAQAGRVLSTPNDAPGYGLYVVIDHGRGYGSLYGHASQVFVKPGDEVEQGQIITACGATGDATGDHLHFEVRVNGQPVDPLPYLP